MGHINRLIFVLLISASIPSFAKVSFGSLSAQNIAFKIFQMQNPNGSLELFESQSSLEWGNLIHCTKNNSWTCELPTVSMGDVQTALQVPDEVSSLPRVIQEQVLENVRSHEFSMVGMSTSGWAQQLFFKDNHLRLRMTAAEDRFSNPIAFLNIEFVSCLIRPQYVGSIHYCWIKGINRRDLNTSF